LQRRDYAAAGATLDEAVLADPDYWVAHRMLAEAALNLHNYEKARDHADLAIQKSKGAGNSARLILGEALANLGKNQEAVTTLEAYLREAPNVPETPQVRDLVAQLQKGGSGRITTLLTPPESSVDDTELRLSIKTWEPPGIDDSRPIVAQGVACPANKVLNQTSSGVKQLVDDIARFGAVEELTHETVDELGHAISKESRKYNYIASVSEDQPGYIEVQEYRLEHSSPAQYPDNMATAGFAALALVFHPDMRANFEFSCEGLGQWHGQATWLVHFRQRDDRPNRIHDFKIGGMIYSINLKGRAWITADKFQIVHMESQLVKPMPNIQLLTEHQVVDYGPVLFKKKNEQLWLPSSADLYLDFRKHRYHRRHSFSHFMLFSTETQDVQSGPKQEPAVAPSSPDQNR
jgi:tetratricopeptide (TPR) repeat protein